MFSCGPWREGKGQTTPGLERVSTASERPQIRKLQAAGQRVGSTDLCCLINRAERLRTSHNPSCGGSIPATCPLTPDWSSRGDQPPPVRPPGASVALPNPRQTPHSTDDASPSRQFRVQASQHPERLLTTNGPSTDIRIPDGLLSRLRHLTSPFFSTRPYCRTYSPLAPARDSPGSDQVGDLGSSAAVHLCPHHHYRSGATPSRRVESWGPIARRRRGCVSLFL